MFHCGISVVNSKNVWRETLMMNSRRSWFFSLCRKKFQYHWETMVWLYNGGLRGYTSLSTQDAVFLSVGWRKSIIGNSILITDCLSPINDLLHFQTVFFPFCWKILKPLDYYGNHLYVILGAWLQWKDKTLSCKSNNRKTCEKSNNCINKQETKGLVNIRVCEIERKNVL